MDQIKKTDLLQYLYQETGKEQHEALSEAIENDWDLKEECQMLETTIQELTTLHYSPSETSVQNILEYARSLETCS